MFVLNRLLPLPPRITRFFHLALPHRDQGLALCPEPVAGCLAFQDHLPWKLGDTYLVSVWIALSGVAHKFLTVGNSAFSVETTPPRLQIM